MRADACSYDVGVSACEKASEWQGALGLASQLGFKASLVAHAAAGSSSGKAFNWQTSAMLLSQAHMKSLQPDLAWWTHGSSIFVWKLF